ncbi:MAG: Holliday junction resolvase RuvX [Gemmatimonadetes bacterium]|nr:MAG: Holliday junction resolvase RuvX [Gemmatimonadota bacterium]
MMEREHIPSFHHSNIPPAGRILAVDWGQRRIGLALSDETQTLAQPLSTLTRRAGKRFPMAQLLDQITRNQVVGIIVGLPLDEAGAEGDAAHAARSLADDIKRRVGELEVSMWDERMTTARVLAAVREMGGSTRGRKEDVDAMAAALLLQHYLDARKGSAL